LKYGSHDPHDAAIEVDVVGNQDIRN
jgi:hypothetical protein